MRSKPKKKVVFPIVVWDMAWKLIAVRRAWKRREYKWVAALVLSNTGGAVPMFYLWRTRGEAGEPGQEQGGRIAP